MAGPLRDITFLNWRQRIGAVPFDCGANSLRHSRPPQYLNTTQIPFRRRPGGRQESSGRQPTSPAGEGLLRFVQNWTLESDGAVSHPAECYQIRDSTSCGVVSVLAKCGPLAILNGGFGLMSTCSVLIRCRAFPKGRQIQKLGPISW